MEKVTESASYYNHLERMSVRELLENINREDQKAPLAAAEAIPQVERVVQSVVEKMQAGGRLFYIGSGTSGRLGILDASECPPTYGVPEDWVIGLIAGGDKAIRKAVEGAEDDEDQGWVDLCQYAINKNDFLIGITASGTTPYVIGAVRKAKENGISTGCITCNKGTPLAEIVDYPIEAVSGPEFVTGSTRMKAGTTQKLILNMITTSVMIRLGKVRGNKMVDMQLTNKKLVSRAVRMIMEETGLDAVQAQRLLVENESVRKSIDAFRASHS